MTTPISLRDVIESDLPVFFEQQRDPAANHMAAFTVKDPADREAFMARWARFLGDPAILIKTIVGDGRVVGSVLSYAEDGRREVSCWLGKEYWGRGLATQALAQFLSHEPTRPLFTRAAKDNLASLRVLQKCGFTVMGEDQGFANARAAEVEEVILRKETP